MGLLEKLSRKTDDDYGRWIDVREKLPEKGSRVAVRLVLNMQTGATGLSIAYYDGGWVMALPTPLASPVPFAWTPLPKA
jgi:hypothetical protein